jgi:hypothetical protein
MNGAELVSGQCPVVVMMLDRGAAESVCVCVCVWLEIPAHLLLGTNQFGD